MGRVRGVLSQFLGNQDSDSCNNSMAVRSHNKYFIDKSIINEVDNHSAIKSFSHLVGAKFSKSIHHNSTSLVFDPTLNHSRKAQMPFEGNRDLLPHHLPLVPFAIIFK